jgi:hypothetical protein
MTETSGTIPEGRAWNIDRILWAGGAVYFLGAVTKLFFPTLYSDIMALYGVYVVGTGHAFPYVNFGLEYPPPVGLLIWFAGFFDFIDPARPIVGYGLAQAAIIFPFAIMLVFYTCKIAQKLFVNETRILSVLVATATFTYFTFYNWDTPTVGLMVAALYYFLEKRYDLSFLLLGTGTIWKLYPGILLPLFLYYAQPHRQIDLRKLRYLAAFAIVPAVFVVPFYLANPAGIIEFLERDFLAGYATNSPGGLEDSWLLYLWMATGSYRAVKIFSYALIGFLALVPLIAFRNSVDDATLVRRALLTGIAGFFGFTGVPPQFLLMLLPLMAVVIQVSERVIRIVDILNVTIIVLWFHVQHGPFSSIQLAATIRQFLLLGVYLNLVLTVPPRWWAWLTNPLGRSQQS